MFGSCEQFFKKGFHFWIWALPGFQPSSPSPQLSSKFRLGSTADVAVCWQLSLSRTLESNPEVKLLVSAAQKIFGKAHLNVKTQKCTEKANGNYSK